ncbi:MAG: hypothetical protein M3463_05210, partial [Verrucomicrobiota bacterium]|nr:hypothetical protein [Verrucomicrobiota bacterium]
ARRQIWHDATGPGNLTFFQKEGAKYFQTRLEGQARHWAIGLAPITRGVPGGRLMDAAGAGPEVRLWQKLSDFSLDAYKDWPLEWDEDLTARPE